MKSKLKRKKSSDALRSHKGWLAEIGPQGECGPAPDISFGFPVLAAGAVHSLPSSAFILLVCVTSHFILKLEMTWKSCQIICESRGGYSQVQPGEGHSPSEADIYLREKRWHASCYFSPSFYNYSLFFLHSFCFLFKNLSNGEFEILKTSNWTQTVLLLINNFA